VPHEVHVGAPGGETIAVTGEAWLDREWSTSALGPDLAGWDWFALQLDDGRELMFYRLRRKDGASEPWSRGSLVAADGSSRTLQPEEILMTPLSTWKSPSGAVYPAAGLARGDARITVLERSRGPGGRLATRRERGAAFDHGAQYVTARSRPFSRYMDAADIASALQYGEIMGYDKVSSGGMGKVQQNISKLPEADIKAIGEYIASLK